MYMMETERSVGPTVLAGKPLRVAVSEHAESIGVRWLPLIIAALCLIGGTAGAAPQTAAHAEIKARENPVSASCQGARNRRCLSGHARRSPQMAIRCKPPTPRPACEYTDYPVHSARSTFATPCCLLERYIRTARSELVRDFPLASLHPTAPKGAMAALCVAEQGATPSANARCASSGPAAMGQLPDHQIPGSSCRKGGRRHRPTGALASDRTVGATNCGGRSGAGLQRNTYIPVRAPADGKDLFVLW